MFLNRFAFPDYFQTLHLRKIFIVSLGKRNKLAALFCYYGVKPKRRLHMPLKILVVDDEIEIADLIETYLADENYSIFKFYSAKDALACIECTDLDLAILDVMLPDIDGFALCKKIREKHTWPIIMLTAKDAETDKITGLTLGADDYVTKPFRPLELAARVKSQLRRYKKYNPGIAPAASADTLMHGDLVLNKKAHTCTLEDRPLELTPTEFSILRILLENQGTAVSSEELFHQI